MLTFKSQKRPAKRKPQDDMKPNKRLRLADDMVNPTERNVGKLSMVAGEECTKNAEKEPSCTTLSVKAGE